MIAKELIKYLNEHPNAKILFDESHFYNDLIEVDLRDFIYKPKANVFVLPDLCKCYPKPN